MALDIDKTKMGSRSSRFGSRARSSFKGRHSSRGVLSMNKGSGPHSGGKSVMRLGGPAGGFGSGRMGGGGPGGGGGAGALAAALMGQAEPMGPPPEVGPPPVDFANIPPRQELRTNPIALPTQLLGGGSERMTSLAPQIPGLFPRSEPTPIDPNLIWQLGQRLAF